MEFVFARDDRKTFESGWEAYAAGDGTLPWAYTLEFFNYMRAYSASIVEDLSFAVRHGGRWAGVAPLFLEKDGQGSVQFSYAGGFGRAPLCGGSADVEREAFSTIDELAKTHAVSRALMMVEPSAWLHAGPKYNHLQKYGYFEASIGSNLIDLRPGEREILNTMRHGHESLIRRRENDYAAGIIDHSRPDAEVFEQYRELHRKDAGRVTRPPETFRQQFDMIQKDKAALIGLKHGGRWAAFAYFYQGKKAVYYGSGAQDPGLDVKNSGLFHCLLMEAVRYYKKRGWEWLETGWQEFGLQPWDRPSEKEIAIAHFKRGFGGINVPLLRGVKYYSYPALETDMRLFLQAAREGIIHGV